MNGTDISGATDPGHEAIVTGPGRPDQAQAQARRAVVIGGGIAGIQAALDLANARIPVTLVESSPTLGGRMAQLDKTFPTMDCAI